MYRECTINKRVDQGKTVPDPDEQFQILNDIVIDRGISPFIANLEVFCDGHHMTTVLADGLLVATTTGSTAYSVR